MKLNYILIVISPVIFTTCTSCVHYYYAPNSNNVPLFKEKNEVRVSAQYVETGGDVDLESADGIEIQTAYAVSNNAAVQLNFLSAGKTDEDGSGSGTYIEAAGGYFKTFGRKKKFVFETYAGAGFGSVKNHFIYNGNGDAKTSIAKGFIQPSLGFASRYFCAAFSSKFSLVTLGSKSSNINEAQHPTDYAFVNSLKGGKSYLFWEPGIMLRGGFEQA
ncbi:MAG: hypothetical protein ABJA35_01485, partial [Parafilimonas sp.]